MSEFFSFLRELSEEVTSRLEDEKEEVLSDAERGSIDGKSGIQFEKDIVALLDSKGELSNYLANNLLVNDVYRLTLDHLLDHLKLTKGDLRSIDATDTVPYLARRGNAKTDVIINIKTDNESFLETISIKKSRAKVVSCHDYKAEDFIRVLGCEGTRLADYFNFFQQHPKTRTFEQSLPKGYSVLEMEALLKSKLPILNEWVLSGRYDSQNLNFPEKQVSKHLLIKTEKGVRIDTIPNYIDLINRKSKLTFGTPFRWTFPSKQEKNRIQLKLPIIP